MQIDPYDSVDSLRFGNSKKSDCVTLYGEPKTIRTNRYGFAEYHYDDFILRFDPITETLRECTLLPFKDATVGGIKVTWDRRFLTAACQADGDALESYGFIVLRKLGIAITGIHDDDESQLAITAFTEGDFDEFLENADPFRPTF